MKIKIILFLVCFLVNTSHFAFGAWVQKANFGGVARGRAVGFSIGTKGYIGTGWNGSTIHYKDFWQWDQGTNTWTQMADFGGAARRNAVGFAVGTKGYIGTGYDNVNYYNDFWEYDPSGNTWTQKANLTGTGRIAATGFSIGTKGYIGTGSHSVTYTDLWEWDQGTNVWTQKANFTGLPRESAVSFSIGTKGYIGTGYYSGTGAFYKDFWEWDQASNTWSQKADFGGGRRRDAVAFSIGTQGYIGTGDSVQSGSTSDIWQWDQTSDTWTQIANLVDSVRRDATGFSIGTCGYIGTGQSLSLFKDFLEICFSVAPPVANFQVSDSSFCSGNCISFTDVSTNNPTGWQWSFTGAIPSSSTVQRPGTVCYPDSGTYNVTLIASNSGGSDTLTLTNVIKVNPVPPTPVITRSNDTLYSTTDSSYISYQWYNDSTSISGATNSFLYVNQSGNYNIKVTGQNGCFTATGINVILGIQLSSVYNIQFDVFPNPVNNQLSFYTSSAKSNEAVMVSIINLLGEVIQSERVFPQSFQDKRKYIINTSELSAGIYFLRVENENGGRVARFVHE